MVSKSKKAAKDPDAKIKSKKALKKPAIKKPAAAKKEVKPKEVKPLKKPITEHELVPSHRIISDDEVKVLLDKYKIKLIQLPKISSEDPVVKLLKDAAPGKVIEIIRSSATAGKTKYFRVILDD